MHKLLQQFSRQASTKRLKFLPPVCTDMLLLLLLLLWVLFFFTDKLLEMCDILMLC